jgi:hypothetical protein
MPYCKAFEAIDSLDDMIEFSKQCRRKAGFAFFGKDEEPS